MCAQTDCDEEREKKKRIKENRRRRRRRRRTLFGLSRTQKKEEEEDPHISADFIWSFLPSFPFGHEEHTQTMTYYSDCVCVCRRHGPVIYLRSLVNCLLSNLFLLFRCTLVYSTSFSFPTYSLESTTGPFSHRKNGSQSSFSFSLSFPLLFPLSLLPPSPPPSWPLGGARFAAKNCRFSLLFFT